MLVRAVKQTWHRDLAAHPDTHAWVLSLYRAGELHPQTVSDYFPSHAAESKDLRASMERHASDEERHVRMYDGAIAKLERERSEPCGLDVFNVAIRVETDATFAMNDVMSRDAKTERLAHFLAHAHFLERRIATSLEYHVDACEHAGRRDVARIVETVRSDEERHAAYTLEAVRDLLPRERASEVIDLHRRGEARANLRFSARQVRSFLHAFAGRASLSHALLYRACASMMEAARAAL
jgi:hypothetical protein